MAHARAGAKAELAFLPAFAELATLLPHHHLDIHFIGPDVPEQLHQHTCRGGPVQSGPQQQEARGECRAGPVWRVRMLGHCCWGGVLIGRCRH